MKKSSIIFVFIIYAAFFMINSEPASALCGEWEYEDSCNGQCAGDGKMYDFCSTWSICNNCGTCRKVCSRDCGSECDDSGGCPFGSCQRNCECCGNYNDPDYLGCCPGYTSWEGKCCIWGEEVDCGYCHEDCESAP